MQAPYRTFVQTWLRLTLALTLGVFIAGCQGALQTVEPGATVTEYRIVDSFDKLDAERALNVTVVVGPANDSVKLVFSEGFLPFVRTTVENGTLRLTIDNEIDISNLQSNLVTITVPALTKITASGAARVAVADTMNVDALDLVFSGASIGDLSVNTRLLTMNASGASLFRLQGWADTFRAAPVSGASIVQAYGLVTRLCTIDASGASILEVQVSETLDVRASGASLVSYIGRPTITSDLTGGSSIVDEN